MSDKTRKAINIAVICLQIMIVIFALVFSIIIIANPTSNASKLSGASTKLLPVMSDSMDGNEKTSFKKGDLVVAKKPDGKKWDAYNLKKGQIITFEMKTNPGIYNTHRIDEVVLKEDGKTVSYYVTKGDKPGLAQDIHPIYPHEVLAIYKKHVKGVGKTILWFQTPKNFLLAIVLPLAILFIYNIVIFVKMMMDRKVEKATAGKESEEELRQKIIDEYLAKNKDQPAAATDPSKASASDAGELESKASADETVKSEASLKEVGKSEAPADGAGEIAPSTESADAGVEAVDEGKP